MADLALIIAVERLLADCPLGTVDHRIVSGRTTTEAEIAAWVIRVYELSAQLSAFVRRMSEMPAGRDDRRA